MNVPKDKRLIAGAAALALLGFWWAGKKTKTLAKVRDYYLPGQRLKAPSGTQFQLKLPRGQYELVGGAANAGIVQIAQNDLGDASMIVIAVPATPMEYTAHPTWVDVTDPKKQYSLTVDVVPLQQKAV